MDNYRARYREKTGDQERMSLPCPSFGAAVRLARLLELQGAEVLAIVGSGGEVDWPTAKWRCDGST